MTRTISPSDGCGFTPGPWEVGGEWPQIVAVYDQRAVYLAHANTGAGSDWIDGVNPLGRDVAIANARLIAAAPELYEALEKCVTKLRRCLSHAGNADFAVDACCEEFDAALAKVRGE